MMKTDFRRLICKCGTIPMASPRICDQCRAYRNYERTMGAIAAYVIGYFVYWLYS